MRCKYIRKIFQNEENGYTVALFSTLDHEVPLSARDKFWADKKIIAFTAKGYDLPLTDEIEIEMEGEWETNSHGTQYKVETFLEVVPRTREGILGYLSCGSLKGIGPKTAERIVNRFGLDTLEVMEKYPQELLKIQGISQKKLDRIVDSFGKNKVFRELMTFLSPFHVTPKKANMILQKFRDQSVEIIRKQPYILCSVKGFGFLTVDAIARQCCAATNDPMRISGCVSYVLREAMKQNGHLYLEQEILVKDALKVLNKELNLQPVTETEILKVLYRLVMQDSIVVEENRVYITQGFLGMGKLSDCKDEMVSRLDISKRYCLEILVAFLQEADIIILHEMFENVWNHTIEEILVEFSLRGAVVVFSEHGEESLMKLPMHSYDLSGRCVGW